MAECGTPAGYQQHVINGDPRCEPCSLAHGEYMRAYRAKNPAAYRWQQDQASLRARALTILGQRHASELRGIQAELRASDG